MFEELVDGVRRASESTLQLQQEMFGNWTRQWLSAAPSGAAPQAGENGAAQKRWFELGLEMLHKHRETLDSTYRSAIQLLETAMHLPEAKSGEDYRKTVEELSRKVFDLQKEQAERRYGDLQTWFEKSAGLAQDVRS
jgi:hypothetical protein